MKATSGHQAPTTWITWRKKCGFHSQSLLCQCHHHHSDWLKCQIFVLYERAGVVRRWERNLEQWQRCQHGKFRRKCNLSQFPALCSAVVTVSNFHCSAERSLTRVLPGARLSTLAALKRELPSIWFSDQIVTHLNVFSQETLKTGNVLGGAPSNLPRIWFRGGLP